MEKYNEAVDLQYVSNMLIKYCNSTAKVTAKQ
jgi:hypothetical protein